MGVTARNKAMLLALIKEQSEARLRDTGGMFDDVSFTHSIHFNKADASGHKWLYVFICKHEIETYKKGIFRTCNSIHQFDEADIIGKEKLCGCGEVIWHFDE